MGLVQRRAPINDAQNKRKAGYFIVDSLSLFYYRYVFRYSYQRQLLDVKTPVEVAGDKHRHVVPLWLAAPDRLRV